MDIQNLVQSYQKHSVFGRCQNFVLTANIIFEKVSKVLKKNESGRAFESCELFTMRDLSIVKFDNYLHTKKNYFFKFLLQSMVSIKLIKFKRRAPWTFLNNVDFIIWLILKFLKFLIPAIALTMKVLNIHLKITMSVKALVT